MPLIINGKLIDKSSPIICVPIVEKEHDDIVAMATRLVAKGVEMVEWRADYYINLMNEEERNKTLSALSSILKDRIFLVTVRTSNEGGNINLEQDEMESLLLEIARTRKPDVIDVEYFIYANPVPIISAIQKDGVAVMVSHHDFEKTPSKNVCHRLLSEMEKSDPDIIKLCFMPNEKKDVFELGAASAEFEKEHGDIPLIIISMGNLGVITRIAPGAFSSSVSFGAVGVGSAPGQMEYNSLKELVDVTGAFYK